MPRRDVVGGLACAAFVLALASSCGGSNAADPASATATFVAGHRSFGATSAVADTKLGGDAATITGGQCRVGASDRFLIFKAGGPSAAEYLYILVGRYPVSQPTNKVTTGGGTFLPSDGMSFAVRHASQTLTLTPESVKLTLAPDISSGTFTGTTADGVAYSAAFTC